MGEDIKGEVIEQIKSAAFSLFSLQLDESTDVASCSHLLVLARYVHSGLNKKEFLFCNPFQSTTKASDVLKAVEAFFGEGNLDWRKPCGRCTDGAPAMIGSNSGFQTLVKEKVNTSKRNALHDSPPGFSFQNTSQVTGEHAR